MAITELMLAATANLLANPSVSDSIDRYKEAVIAAITEAAYAQLLNIVVRVPDSITPEITEWLKSHGYNLEQADEQVEGWSFYNVNWGSRK